MEREELRLWREFYSLTEQQSILIKQEDSDGLQASLDARALVIKALSDLRADSGDPLPDDVSELRDKAMALNAENERGVRAWLENIENDIQKIKLYRQSAEGYGGALGYLDAEYLDETV